jgi:hypothetical protein
MPNWCNNTIEISHEDRSKMEALVAAVNEGKFFNHVIPVPESLHIVAGRAGADETDEQKALVEAQTKNMATHGYKDWYDFCVNTWGTKWDTDPYNPVELPADSNKVTFGFDTAWGPATGVYDALMDQGFSVRAYYYEPGMAFCGIHDENGDDSYEIGGMSADDVADMLPTELDEMFCISDCIREYEEDNEDPEELTEWYKEGVAQRGLELKTE